MTTLDEAVRILQPPTDFLEGASYVDWMLDRPRHPHFACEDCTVGCSDRMERLASIGYTSQAKDFLTTLSGRDILINWSGHSSLWIATMRMAKRRCLGFSYPSCRLTVRCYDAMGSECLGYLPAGNCGIIYPELEFYLYPEQEHAEY